MYGTLSCPTIPVVRVSFHTVHNFVHGWFHIVAEIAIEKCFIDPELVRGMCVPHSATHEDAVKGKWVRVGPDLNQETSMTYLVG